MRVLITSEILIRINSSYPIIISIENHCSAEQRKVMAEMFIKIFGGMSNET